MSAHIWDFLGPPPTVQVCPHLVDHLPSPCPCGHKTGIIWNIATCERFTLKGKKMHSKNSIPKDGVDHEVNVTHRHDWPNKNASIPKSLYGKRKDFIYRSKFHKYGSYNFFFQADVHIWLTTPLPLSAFAHFCLTSLPPSPLMCRHPLLMTPK